MLKPSVRIEDLDLGMQDLMRRIQEASDHVDIGIQPDEEQTLIVIAAANEYGATIHHPGGTDYGYLTDDDRKHHRVRFLKKGAGVKVLGTTGPHVITIPARSYIRSTVDENHEKYDQTASDLLGRIVDGDTTKHHALELMGQLIEADIKRKIQQMRYPPNAPSTLRAKFPKTHPLINTGLLLNSVRYVVGQPDGE